MFCSKCGAAVPEGAAFCNACGQPVTGGSAPTPVPSGPSSSELPSVWQTRGVQPPAHFAGFWLRLVAYIIDWAILGFVTGILIILPLMGNTLRALATSGKSPFEFYMQMNSQIVAVRLLVLMAGWLYFALLESSPWQATLGKKALGLLVTDLAGRRVSFARASGRYFGKIVSAIILFIGFLMAGFTEKKQALHDILAGCLVIRKL